MYAAIGDINIKVQSDYTPPGDEHIAPRLSSVPTDSHVAPKMTNVPPTTHDSWWTGGGGGGGGGTQPPPNTNTPPNGGSLVPPRSDVPPASSKPNYALYGGIAAAVAIAGFLYYRHRKAA